MPSSSCGKETAAAQIAQLGTLLCWVLSCSWCRCDGLRCTSSIPEAMLNTGNCSFCVTLTDNLLQAGDAHRIRSFCSLPLSSTELTMSLDDFDARFLGDSIQPHQLESFTARRLTKICLAGCESVWEDAASPDTCGYTAASTANITDSDGDIFDTVVVSNLTYLCCRGSDNCNSVSRRVVMSEVNRGLF